MINVRVLSESGLVRRLNKLRRRLLQSGCVREAGAAGVVFLNAKAFMRYCARFCDMRELSRLVGEIQPYIPVRVNDNALNGLLEAAAGGYENAMRFEKRLTARSLLDFLQAAAGQDDEKWQEAVSMSILIRNYKSAASV